jgi:hypothetical protein
VRFIDNPSAEQPGLLNALADAYRRLESKPPIDLPYQVTEEVSLLVLALAEANVKLRWADGVICKGCECGNL